MQKAESNGRQAKSKKRTKNASSEGEMLLSPRRGRQTIAHGVSHGTAGNDKQTQPRRGERQRLKPLSLLQALAARLKSCPFASHAQMESCPFAQTDPPKIYML